MQEHLSLIGWMYVKCFYILGKKAHFLERDISYSSPVYLHGSNEAPTKRLLAEHTHWRQEETASLAVFKRKTKKDFHNSGINMFYL